MLATLCWDIIQDKLILSLYFLRLVKAALNVLRMKQKYAKVLQ